MKDGGAAFPCPRKVEPGKLTSVYHDGMTLRDYFAGQALVGLLGRQDCTLESAKVVAPACYEIADSMLRVDAAMDAASEGDTR